MLKKNAKDRISAKDALNHKFFTETTEKVYDERFPEIEKFYEA